MSTIKISHTRRDGTLVDGTERGDGSADILGRGGLGFRWSSDMGVWYLRGSRDRAAKQHLINQAKDRLENAGFSVAVLVDNVAPGRTAAQIEADLSDRAEGRADRYSGYASNAANRSEDHDARCREMAYAIPMGQPVMSRADAKYRERIRSAAERSYREAGKAEHWGDRAEAVARRLETHGSIHTTLGRIEALEKEERQLLGQLNSDPRPANAGVLEADLAHVQDQVAHWRAQVKEKAEETDQKLFSPDDIKKGDYVFQHGTWFEVLRVSRKSVTVPWMIHGVGAGVWTLEHAKACSAGDKPYTDTVPYKKITRTATAAELREQFPARFPADQ